MGLKNKKLFTCAEDKDYTAIRTEEVRQVRLVKKPADVKASEERLSGVRVSIISRDCNPRDRVIFYIHGGGFVTGSPESRIMFTYFLAHKFSYNVIAVDYRLAPECPYPAGVEDCYRVYEILEKRYGAKNIVIMGESAGANLTLVTLLKIRENHLGYPAASFVFSPCVQYTRELPSYRNNAPTEAMVTNLSDEVKSVYVCSTAEKIVNDPFISPCYGDFSGCSPIYLFASTTEVLFDDSKIMFETLKRQRVPVDLYVRKGMVHTWIIIPSIPEAKKDLKLIKELTDKAFQGDAKTSGEVKQLPIEKTAC